MRKLFLSLLKLFIKEPLIPEHYFRKSKTVYQVSLLDFVIQQYPSVNEAARQTKIDCGSITKVCNGKRHTAGGYKWKYKK